MLGCANLAKTRRKLKGHQIPSQGYYGA